MHPQLRSTPHHRYQVSNCLRRLLDAHPRQDLPQTRQVDTPSTTQRSTTPGDLNKPSNEKKKDETCWLRFCEMSSSQTHTPKLSPNPSIDHCAAIFVISST